MFSIGVKTYPNPTKKTIFLRPIQYGNKTEIMKNPNRKSRELESSKKFTFGGDGIKNLDIMGEKFKFNYERKGGKYRTRLGGCVSIVVAALSLVFLVFISTQYFDTSSPIVTTTRELSSSQSLNIVGQDLFSGIALSHTEFLETQFFNLITLRFQLMRKSFDPRTNTTKTEPIKTIKYTSCAQSTDQSVIDLLKKVVNDVNLNQYICPVFKEVDNNVTLSSDPQNFSSTYLSLKVYPCSLPDRSQCYPVKATETMRLIIPKISNLVSPSNYEDPVAFRWKVTVFLIDMTRTRYHRDILEINQITDDRSFFQKPQVKAEYGLFKIETTDFRERDVTQLYCTPSMIDSGECEEFVNFVFEMDNEVVITKRRYKKIPQLIGEFGGILKLLTTTFVIISFYYTKSIKRFLFKRAFGIEKSTAKHLVKKVRKSLQIDNQKNEGSHLGKPKEKGGGHQAEGCLSKKIIAKNYDSAPKEIEKESINPKSNLVELAKK